MSPLKKSNNIAARMGRWSASHWKTAVVGWLAFVVVSLVVGMTLGTKSIDQNDANVGQSHRADHILRDAGFQADPQTEIVLVQSKKLTARDAAFRTTVDDVVAAVEPLRRELVESDRLRSTWRLEFEPPAGAPGADLLASPAVYWRLCVEASGPRAGYRETLLVPVFDRATERHAG